MRTISLPYRIVLAGSFLWCALLVIAPLTAGSSGILNDVSWWIYRFFHSICHQDEARSFEISGHPMAVCIRCAAIYGSFLAGVILFPFVRRDVPFLQPPKVLLLVAIVPIVLDVVSGWAGVHEPDTFSRVVTGLLFGGIISFFILPGFFQAVQQSQLNHPTNQTVKV